MAKEKVIVSKVKIEMKNSDGSNSKINTTMPKEIADVMFCDFIQWRDTWTASFNLCKEFEEEEKKFK